jgi:hypothetical protein
MMRYLLIITVLFFAACNPHKDASKALNVKVNYVDPNAISINGHLKFIDSYNNALIYLGKPDSTVKPDYGKSGPSYNGHNFQYCYFKGVKFEKYNDSLVFRSIKLITPQMFVAYPRFTFNNSVTLSDVSKKLPGVISDTLKRSAADKSIAVRVNMSDDKNDTSDKWVLTFDSKTQKLLELDYWIGN